MDRICKRMLLMWMILPLSVGYKMDGEGITHDTHKGFSSWYLPKVPQGVVFIIWTDFFSLLFS